MQVAQQLRRSLRCRPSPLLGLVFLCSKLALDLLKGHRIGTQTVSEMQSASNFTQKWSFRSLFSSSPSRPPPRLLDEAFVDRHVVHKAQGNTIAMKLGHIRGGSAIASLPGDLLERVFQTYLEMVGQSSTARGVIKYSHARLHAPFLLSSVCRAWRAHALASPLLWTYVVVPKLVHGPSTATYLITRHIKRQLKQFTKRWLELIQLLLERSGQAGLHIVIPRLHVTYLEPKVAKEFELHRRATLALASHCARFRSLVMSVDGPASSLKWAIIGISQVGDDGTLNLHTPHLEYIRLRIGESEIEKTGPHMVHICAPQLRVCKIDGAACLRPQQSHLVRLEMATGAITSTTWTQIVCAYADTLENLQLHLSASSEGSEHTLLMFKQPLPKVIFPCLTHFGIASISYEHNSIISEMFAFISAPVLHLAYFAPSYQSQPWGSTFIQFAQYLNSPSNGTVKELVLSYPVQSPMLDIRDARTITRHLPSVEVLTLNSFSDVAVGFIGAMHHIAPQITIYIESGHVRMPTRLEQLTIAVDTSATAQRLAFFDVTRADRDYDNVSKTEDIYPDRQCTIQRIEDVIIVWKDGPIARGEEDEEHTLGPRYQIIPSQMTMTPNPSYISYWEFDRS